MRISTGGAFQRGLSLMQHMQSAVDRTQQQISSGRRILNPSDDPIAASRSLEINEAISRLTQFDRNGVMAKNRLHHEESALGDMNNVLQRVRELALQANNATQSNESRTLIAVEMRQHLDQLVQLANQQDGNGRYLFSGNMDDTEPVTRNGAAYIYNGDQGQRLIQIADSRQVADGDPGSDLFFRIKNGSGVFAVSPDAANTGTGVSGAGSLQDPSQYDQDQYTIRFIDAANYEVLDSTATVIATNTFTSGDTIAFRGIEFSLNGAPAAGDEFDVSPSQFEDVFSTISNLADAVDGTISNDASRAAVTNAINAGILNVDQAIGNSLEIRTQVGSRLAAIEDQEDSNGAITLNLQASLADIEDLDYAEAISTLSQQMTVLQAAQQTFVRTQNLSLFNYLR
ncbi:MAG: flagellar hook-associated protein FlgL [Woeseiaceae bacterium]